MTEPPDKSMTQPTNIVDGSMVAKNGQNQEKSKTAKNVQNQQDSTVAKIKT